MCVCVIFIRYDRRTSDTHTHPFNGPLSGTTRVSRYQKGKTNLDFIEARDSEWQWHQLGHMQVCTLLQTDNHARQHSTAQLLQAGCPSCRPTNSVKALKAYLFINAEKYMSKCLHNMRGCVPVLPKFEVSIVHPGPVLNDDSGITWKVCAQYVRR